MSTNYKGAIINKLYNAVQKNPDKTMGEILHSFLCKKSMKSKHYFEATDEEIYNSLENFIETKEEQDEPLDEIGWNFWVQKHLTEKQI